MDATDGRNAHITAGALISGHFHHRAYGLTVHPIQSNLLCTVGDDKTIRVFDCSLKKMVRMVTTDNIPHCCRYTSDGMALIIGVGSGDESKPESKEGAHILVNAEDLTILHEARDSKVNRLPINCPILIFLNSFVSTIFEYLQMESLLLSQAVMGQ